MATKTKENKFAAYQRQAKKWNIDQLLFAIKDCQETIKAFEIDGGHPCLVTGKYYDQIAVFTQEINKKRSAKRIRRCPECRAVLTTNEKQTRYCYYCGTRIILL